LGCIVSRKARRPAVLKFGIVGATGFVVNLIVFTLLQRPCEHDQAVPYYLIYSFAFLAGGRLELLLQPGMDVPLDRPRRQRGRAVPLGLDDRARRRLVVSAVLARTRPRPQDVVRRDRVGHLRQLLLNKYWTFKTSTERRGRSILVVLVRASGILLLAFALRLHGITIRSSTTRRGPGRHRSIAGIRALQYNIVAPRTTTTVPAQLRRARAADRSFLAATLYKTFGVHEISAAYHARVFARTVAVLGLFGRWLFGTWIAGLGAAFVYAVMPAVSTTGAPSPRRDHGVLLDAALYASARS